MYSLVSNNFSWSNDLVVMFANMSLLVSRPKSMEHEFKCMTNLLNSYNSINIINPK